MLEGQPYGHIRIPTNQLTDLRMDAIRGSLVSMPDVTLSLEVRQGGAGVNGNGRGKNGAGDNFAPAEPKVVDIPLRRVEVFRRDVGRQLASVTLGDGQVFSGRIVQLPSAPIEVEVDPQTHTIRRYPLNRIAQFETTIQLLDRPLLGTPR